MVIPAGTYPDQLF
jgi:radial spoke head protein 3